MYGIDPICLVCGWGLLAARQLLVRPTTPPDDAIICRDCFSYTLSRSCKREHHWMCMSRDPHFACPCSTQRQAPTVRIHTRTTQAIRTLSAPIQFSGTTEPDAICRRRCGEGASGRALCYGGGSGSLIPPHIHMQRTSSTGFTYAVARLRLGMRVQPTYLGV